MDKVNGKKVKKILMICLVAILILTIIILGFLWNRYFNKNNLLHKYTDNAQEIYILGTLHDYHFKKYINYSIEDILSVVENVRPDAVFIEAREEYFKEYGVVDGPVEMSVLYSYCIENNISIEMIDWWIVDNKYQSNATSKRRDDMIFNNINRKLSSLNNNSKALIVCGTGHLYEQSNRFLRNGYKEMKIENITNLFENKNEFTYPQSCEKIWEQRAYFYAYTYPTIIENTKDLESNIKSQFLGGNPDEFYKQQIKYCQFFLNNELYE